MSQNQETITVESDSRVLGKAFVQFAIDLKAALKAGTVITEAIQISGAVLHDLVPVLSKFGTVDADIKESLQAEVNTAFLTGCELVAAFKS